jgi:chemotaxis protein histidine kinase CheA
MNIFGKKLKMNNRTIGKVILAILVFMFSLPQESGASDDFFGRLFGNWQFSHQAGANAQQATQSAEREKAAIKAAAEKEKAEKEEAERQARRQEIATRMALEKEAAQKQIAQRQEDERKAEIRRQQRSGVPESQVRIQQPSSNIPQSVEQQLATEAHQSGQSFGSSLLGGVSSAAKSTNPHDVPGFQTDKPKEAFLNAGTLGDAALAESSTNETAQYLHTQAKDRKTFKIDPETDPLFVGGNRVVSNPQKALNEEIVAELDSDGGVSEEIKTCEEGGEEYSQSCSKRLEVALKITPQAGYYTPKWCIEHWANKRTGRKYKCGGCRGGDYVITQHKKVEATDKWIDGCTVLEDLTEKGLCRYESKITSTKNETKTIQGEPINRDHFEEHYRYTCFKAPPVSNSCAGLREKGCFQIDSKCKEQARLEKVGDVCVLWEQTYSCPSGKKSLKSYRASSKENPTQTSLFCLTGNCADTSFEANNEMMNAMSHLYALREVQNDLRDFKVIFKGTHRWCTRNCLDFRDCCGDGKGWGVSLHLSSCDAKEIELKTLRDKRLCVQIGTYCAERDAIFNSCLRKKTTFCCYGTKMARLIQENGRAQLGIGFGSPESPNCEGLSPEQLSRIDFSKINFSEIFEDIKSQTVTKDQKQSLAQVSTERLQNNMTLLTQPSLDQKHLDAKSTEELQKLKKKGL